MSTLCLVMLLVLPAKAEKIPDDYNADVVATGTVQAPPQAVMAWISDLRNQEIALADCTRKWVHGDNTVALGASAELVYRMGAWRRKLVATVSEIDDARRLTLDHAGKKGFYTTWTLTPSADGSATQVEVRTLLNLAPRPFRKWYVNKVQPQWELCYQAAILRVDEAVR